MNLADVLTVVFLVLGFTAVFISYWLMAAGLFPSFVERSAERFAHNPTRLALVGLVTLGPLLLIGGQMSSNGPNGVVKVLGIALLLIAFLVALFGSAGLAQRIGFGLKAGRDDVDPWRRMLRGSIVLGLTFMLPFVGTFLILPYAFFAGFGAVLLGLRGRPALSEVPPTMV